RSVPGQGPGVRQYAGSALGAGGHRFLPAGDRGWRRYRQPLRPGFAARLSADRHRVDHLFRRCAHGHQTPGDAGAESDAGLYAKGRVDCRSLQPLSPGRVCDAERLRRGRVLHRREGWLTRDVGMNVPLAGSLHTFGLGATGLSCNQTNFIPRTCRQYVDCYERGDLAAVHQMYADLHRFTRFVEQWRGARWQKMALRVFKLPGGEGGLRKPYLMPTDAEVERFTSG